MALEFLNNAKENFINALFGTPTQVEGSNQSIGYGKAIDNYLNNLGEQEYIKKMLNKPVEERMSLDTIRKGVANGLNYSVPEIAQAQKELGINTPKTGEEIYKAQLGEFNQPTTLNVGVSNAPRQGGLVNDFISGFRENATQGFDVNNLAPQRKGLATRIGEGLGTLARFYDRPIGRMAVATGLSMLTDEVNPLQEGIRAYVGRQTNMTKDKAYRQNLQQMGYTQEEIDSIPGIVNDQVYTNLIRAQQLRDNAEYRNMLLENNAQERAAALEFQRMKDVYDRAQKNREFNYRAQQDAIDNEFKRQELANKQQKGASGNINNLNAVNAQLQRFEDSFADMPGKIESNTLGRVRAATGFQTKQEANFNSQRQLLFNKIARDLGGEKGVLSDQDIKRIEGALPSYTDSLEQKNAKMEAIYDLLNDRLAVEGGSLQQPQQTSETTQIGNYKVRVK